MSDPVLSDGPVTARDMKLLRAAVLMLAHAMAEEDAAPRAAAGEAAVALLSLTLGQDDERSDVALSSLP